MTEKEKILTFSPKIKYIFSPLFSIVFSNTKTNHRSRWRRKFGLLSTQRQNECACSADLWFERESITNAPLQSPNSHLLPQYFFCWIRYVMEEVRRNLSWKRQPYLFWFGLIHEKRKQTMEILKMPPFCRVRLLTGDEHAHSFCRCVIVVMTCRTCADAIQPCRLWMIRQIFHNVGFLGAVFSIVSVIACCADLLFRLWCSAPLLRKVCKETGTTTARESRLDNWSVERNRGTFGIQTDSVWLQTCAVCKEERWIGESESPVYQYVWNAYQDFRRTAPYVNYECIFWLELPGGGTPVYELYRYVPLWRVWFSASLLSNRV